MQNKRAPINILSAYAEFLKAAKYKDQKLNFGRKRRNSTLMNYVVIQNHLKTFIEIKPELGHIPWVKSKSFRELNTTNKFWKKFGTAYIKYLQVRSYGVNYIGLHMKVMRTFLRWLETHKNVGLGEYKCVFVLLKEETPIITLSITHLHQLMSDTFLNSLPFHLHKTAKLMLFGCTVGLRYSDLISLTYRNIEKRDGAVYLVQRSQKTDTDTRIKLPDYAIEILKTFKGEGKKLLPFPSMNQFNINLKHLGEKAGWTEDVGKVRLRNGRLMELKTQKGKKYRFCDLLSSHIMRKTAITTLLMNGMPEHMVRRISGHAPNSTEFFRYVRYSQSFMDEYTDAVFHKIMKSVTEPALN